MIERIDFARVVYGAFGRPQDNFKPKDWPKWSAKVEGATVILEGEGRRIEVPREQCIIYRKLEPLPEVKVDGRTKEAKAMKAASL